MSRYQPFRHTEIRQFSDGTIHEWDRDSLSPSKSLIYYSMTSEPQAYEFLVRATRSACSRYYDAGANVMTDTKVEAGEVDSPSRPSILDKAREIIYGDREKTYGDPTKNLGLIANLWSNYLNTPVTISDVCNLMMLLKVARLKNSPDHKDSQVDICGYAALMERCQDYMEAQREKDLTSNTIDKA